MLQLLVVQRQARIDDDGSLCVLWSSHVGVSLIGLERIPNLYEREKHSLYDPVKNQMKLWIMDNLKYIIIWIINK